MTLSQSVSQSVSQSFIHSFIHSFNQSINQWERFKVVKLVKTTARSTSEQLVNVSRRLVVNSSCCTDETIKLYVRWWWWCWWCWWCWSVALFTISSFKSLHKTKADLATGLPIGSNSSCIQNVSGKEHFRERIPWIFQNFVDKRFYHGIAVKSAVVLP